jgi:protein-S-isoprenylcysteine O-methyltransferase Ste14
LSAFYLAVSYGPMLFVRKTRRKPCIDFSWLSRRGKWSCALVMLFYIAILIIPVFSNITTNKMAFGIGTGLLFMGGVGAITSSINYFTTPLNEVIRKGMYRISRNPIYISITVIGIGIAIMCESIALALILAAEIILQHMVILDEEKFCHHQYSEAYLEYKAKVPRYILF